MCLIPEEAQHCLSSKGHITLKHNNWDEQIIHHEQLPFMVSMSVKFHWNIYKTEDEVCSTNCACSSDWPTDPPTDRRAETSIYPKLSLWGYNDIPDQSGIFTTQISTNMIRQSYHALNRALEPRFLHTLHCLITHGTCLQFSSLLSSGSISNPRSVMLTSGFLLYKKQTTCTMKQNTIKSLI